MVIMDLEVFLFLFFVGFVLFFMLLIVVTVNK